MRLKIVDKERYELLEKMVQRQDNYIEQIKIRNKELEELAINNSKLSNLIEEKDLIIKKLRGRIGGLTKSNNIKINDNVLLKNQTKELKNCILNLQNKLNFYDRYGHKNEKLEKLKNYKEIRKELEKRGKDVYE